MYTKITNFITIKLFSFADNDHSEEALWTRYFVEVILINLFKTFFVLIISIILKCTFITIISLLIFIPLRKYAGGWHSNYSLLCSIQSIIFFSIVPKIFLLTSPLINWKLSTILFIIVSVLFFLYAPQSESLSKKKINKKVKCIMILLFLYICLILVKINWIKYCIIIGELTACVLILPCTSKIIKGDGIVNFKEKVQKNMRKWVSAQINEEGEKNKFSGTCPWPFLIYEPKKTNVDKKK